MDVMEHQAEVECQERKDQWVSLENKVHQVNQELLEMLVFQVRKEGQVPLATEDELVAQECEEEREKKEAKEPQVHLVKLDLLALLANGVELDHQALPVQSVHQVLRVLLVFADHLVLTVHPVEGINWFTG